MTGSLEQAWSQDKTGRQTFQLVTFPTHFYLPLTPPRPYPLFTPCLPFTHTPPPLPPAYHPTTTHTCPLPAPTQPTTAPCHPTPPPPHTTCCHLPPVPNPTLPAPHTMHMHHPHPTHLACFAVHLPHLTPRLPHHTPPHLPPPCGYLPENMYIGQWKGQDGWTCHHCSAFFVFVVCALCDCGGLTAILWCSILFCDNVSFFMEQFEQEGQDILWTFWTGFDCCLGQTGWDGWWAFVTGNLLQPSQQTYLASWNIPHAFPCAFSPLFSAFTYLPPSVSPANIACTDLSVYHALCLPVSPSSLYLSNKYNACLLLYLPTMPIPPVNDMPLPACYYLCTCACHAHIPSLA